MEILHDDNKNKGQFYIEDNAGRAIASLVYTYKSKDVIVIEHTEVDPSLKGQGIGSELVESSVDFARNEQLKILPLCEYADSVFKKNKAYSDVLVS